jgi:heavy metal sensor kinase
MPFAGRQLSELFQTLRFRLTLWITLVVTLMVVLTMLTVRAVVLQRLQADFDQVLIENTKDISPLINQFHTKLRRLAQELDSKVHLHSDRGLFLQIFGADKHLLWSSTNVPAELPPPDFSIESRQLFDFGGERVLEVPPDTALGEGQPGPPFFLRSGCSRGPLQEDVELVNNIMLLASSLIILLAPLGGFVLAGRATRPIAWIISTAARLQPSNLNERLPIRGNGDELDQLSQTINGMLDRIASYIERNQEFVANAAHELRSPLAAIRSTVEVGLNRGRTPEEYALLLGEVMEEVTRLANLVNRLLLLAEGDAGRLGAKDQATRLDKIVRESVDMFEAVAESQDVRLTAGALPPALVPGDEFHVRQVVRNLIDNAIKFSPAPGTVEVSLHADLLRKQAVLSVKDQGIGIPAEMQPHIFDRFYRVDKSRNRLSRRGGSGLGLSICRSIVTALQGEIAVDSPPSGGSTFTVRLPMLVENTLADEKHLVLPSSPRELRVGEPGA